jgi:hypothetical protein
MMNRGDQQEGIGRFMPGVCCGIKQKFAAARR